MGAVAQHRGMHQSGVTRFLALEHLRVIAGTAAMFARSSELRAQGWLPAAVTSSAPRRNGGEVGRWEASREARRLGDEARRLLAAGDRSAAADALSKLADLQHKAQR